MGLLWSRVQHNIAECLEITMALTTKVHDWNWNKGSKDVGENYW